MAADEFRIVFDEDGYPRELISRAERERAVRDGSLRPDTIVIVYRSGAAPVSSRADRFPELRDLFAPPAKDEAAAKTPTTQALPLRQTDANARHDESSRPPAEPPPEAVAEPAGSAARKVEADAPPTELWAVAAGEDFAEEGEGAFPQPAQAQEPAPRRTNLKLWAWGIGLFLVAVQIRSCLTGPDQPSTTNKGAGYQIESFESPRDYVVAPKPGIQSANLRKGPGGEHEVILMLPRGTGVVGMGSATGSDGARWISVTTADQTAGFVAERLLRSAPAPAPEQASAPAPDPTPALATATATDNEISRAKQDSRAALLSRDGPVKSKKTTLAPSQEKVSGPAGPPPGTVICILPTGSEIRTTRANCRAQSGVIY